MEYKIKCNTPPMPDKQRFCESVNHFNNSTGLMIGKITNGNGKYLPIDEIIANNPNDAELGKQLRKIINRFNE